jgi:hypothetical protein
MPDPVTMEEWLGCLSLPEYLSKIPTGQIRPIVGPIIWIDGNGVKLSAEEYIDKWGIDPEPAWAAIKEYRKQHGGGVRA